MITVEYFLAHSWIKSNDYDVIDLVFHTYSNAYLLTPVRKAPTPVMNTPDVYSLAHTVTQDILAG